MNVLILDNDEKTLDETEATVRKTMSGADVYSFSETEYALEELDETVFDFAFLDTELSDMPCIVFAEKLKKKSPKVNIIFLTEDDYEFAFDAFQIHASGYLLKPPAEKDVKEEVANRRYTKNVKTVEENECKVIAKTFGQFDLLVNGKSVHFKRAKSKEAIAYLIDRVGGGVTKKDIASVIFEESLYTENVQDYLGKILREMEKTLKDNDIGEILIKSHNYYAVDKTKIKCDLFDFMDEASIDKPSFFGEYMSQYSWAESTLANLYFFDEKNGGGDY